MVMELGTEDQVTGLCRLDKHSGNRFYDRLGRWEKKWNVPDFHRSW